MSEVDGDVIDGDISRSRGEMLKLLQHARIVPLRR